ncbi:hypothetical protein ED312_02900 [Sinomicrobium pectinilyticum]|uniref:Uncharacterized protein n=1 Tax=Sinomicrobium pectinilyticum TaxID=1084421 RepID=A0A3N0EYR4_SINP1|nr:hypothetical protein ED312_02900 [Sinomicrobium pectinilyticum]
MIGGICSNDFPALFPLFSPGKSPVYPICDFYGKISNLYEFFTIYYYGLFKFILKFVTYKY